MTQQSIALWERGEAFPARRHWATLAQLLGMDLGQFYEFVGVGAPVTGNLIEELLLKIATLAPEQLEIVQKATAELDLKYSHKDVVASKQHLSFLKKGVREWNKWREKNPDIIPMLIGIDLNQENCDNLEGFNLACANLANIEGINVSFREANLEGANLEGASLKEVDLTLVNLKKANLSNVSLKQVNLSNSNIESANLKNALLSYTWLKEVNLKQSDLRQAKFVNVFLNNSNLNCANLESAQILNSDVREVNFNGANLSKVLIKKCAIYGISVWDVKTNEMQAESLCIFPDGRSGILVNDLLFSSSFYLCYQYPEKASLLKKTLILQEQAKELVQNLLYKFGEYAPKQNHRIYINNESYPKLQGGVKYRIFQKDEVIKVEKFPDFEQLDSLLSQEFAVQEIFRSDNQKIQSLLDESDVDNLKILNEYEFISQQSRFALIEPILKVILTEKKSYADKSYKIKSQDKELVLATNSEEPVELMRVKINEQQWQVKNSSLSEKLVNHFQSLKLN